MRGRNDATATAQTSPEVYVGLNATGAAEACIIWNTFRYAFSEYVKTNPGGGT